MRTANAWLCALALLWPLAAQAEPIKLERSFFTSDRTVAYRAAIEPFVDATAQRAPISIVDQRAAANPHNRASLATAWRERAQIGSAP